MADRKRAEKRGRRGEYLAAAALVLKGYSILEMRYKTPFGEVDIIARRGKAIAFVEVKARATIEAAVNAVSYKSRQRICAAGAAYLTRRRLEDYNQRYDIIAVRPWRWPAHIRDAWRSGDLVGGVMPMSSIRFGFMIAVLFAFAACGSGEPRTHETHMLSTTAQMLNKGFIARAWKRRHQAKLTEKLEQPVDLLFIGDSLTHMWEEDGKKTWDRYYADRRAFNLGISGDRTETLLWRLQQGAVDGLSPKLVILQIGTNNTGHRMDPPGETLRGIQVILEELRARLPEAEILLLAIFPRGADADDAERVRNREINILLVDMSMNELVHFRNINDVLLDKSGAISKSVMPDYLHLSPKGYELWAAAIEDDVARLLAN